MKPGDFTQVEKDLNKSTRQEDSFKFFLLRVSRRVFDSWFIGDNVFYILFSNGIILKITYEIDFSSSSKYKLEILTEDVDDAHIISYNEMETGLFSSDRIAFFIEYYAYKSGTFT